MKRPANQNLFIKALGCLVFGVMALGIYKFMSSSKGDFRLAVQAVHSCIGTFCGGSTCSIYSYTSSTACSGHYGCYADANCAAPTARPTVKPTPAEPYCSTEMNHDCLYGCIPSSNGGRCVPMPTAAPTAVPTPLIIYSCSGNQYCGSICDNSGPSGTNAKVTCLDSEGGKPCPGQGDYYVYLTRCVSAPTGATGKICTSCYDYSGGGWYDDCGGSGTGSCPGAGAVVPTELPGGGTSTCNCADYSSEAAATCNTTTFYCPTSNPAASRVQCSWC